MHTDQATVEDEAMEVDEQPGRQKQQQQQSTIPTGKTIEFFGWYTMYIYIFLFLAVPAVPDTEVDEVPVQIQTTHNERRRQQHDPDAITADSMMEPSGRQPPTCKTDLKYKKMQY